MVIIMNSLKDVGLFLRENDNYSIIVHRSPDGDAIGSSSALCILLRKMGKNAKIITPTPVNSRLSFMWDEDLQKGDFETKTVITLDVADTYMMLDYYENLFLKVENTLSLDHHATNPLFAKVNYVDPTASASGEVVYDVLCELGEKLTKDIASALFVAIADDTGGFMYSNTTSKTHNIVSKLYEHIENGDEILRNLFATYEKEEISLLKCVLNNMSYHFDSKVCISYVTQKDLELTHADISQSDAWISLLRETKGVEVGVMFKEVSKNVTRVSLRSNSYVDVSSIAKKFGGGGHVRASGVTFENDLEYSINAILQEVKKLV